MVASLRWMADIGFVTDRTHMGTAEMGREEPRRKGILGLRFWLFVLVVIVYPLSFGPIVKMGIVPEKVVIYKPLVFLYANSAVVTTFYDWYLFDFWKVK